MATQHVSDDPVKFEEFKQDYQNGIKPKHLIVKYGLANHSDTQTLLRKAGLKSPKPKYAKREVLESDVKTFTVKVSGVKCVLNLPGSMSAEVELANDAINFTVL